MAVTLTLKKYTTPFNPEAMLVQVGVSGNYATGGDTLDLTPSKILDPSVKGVVGPNQVPSIAPGVFTANLGGYRAEVVPGTTLAGFKLKFYAPAGTEVPAGAYPAAITGGNLVLMITFANF